VPSVEPAEEQADNQIPRKNEEEVRADCCSREGDAGVSGNDEEDGQAAQPF
jgi:hypothetical protein